MPLPNRKQNRLQNYDYSTAGAYFITICTKNKAKILCEIVGGGAPSSTPSRVGAGVPSSTHYRVGGGALDAPQIILSPLGKTVEKYILSSERIKGISVSKYVIMPNHIHLLVCIDVTDVGGAVPYESCNSTHGVCFETVGKQTSRTKYFPTLLLRPRDPRRGGLFGKMELY